MGKFKSYQHIERWGTDEVLGIEYGVCYLFPKIDGTNGSVWESEGKLCAGSRNRELYAESDNAGFYKWVSENENLKNYFKKYPEKRLFGEWLVPHTLKTYRENAWKKFYVFDVCVDEINTEGGMRYVNYEKYTEELSEFGIDYIPCLAKITQPTYEDLIHWLNLNNYLIEDGKGLGEGIVIKNYEFVNKYRRQTWAKIVRSEFKEEHVRTMGPAEYAAKQMVETRIVEQFCTNALIEKTYAKILEEIGTGWRSEYIPRFLNTVYHELVREESWNFVKNFKDPTVNFKTLKALVFSKVKLAKREIF